MPDEIGFRASKELIHALDEIALERSEPGDRVTRSDVAREAVSEFIERNKTEQAAD